MPVSFKVSDVKRSNEFQFPKRSVEEIKQNEAQKIYRSTGTELARVPFDNGFIGTVFSAYCHHYNLTVSPDHIWCAIMHAFNTYMNTMGKAESLRDKFVYHEGQAELEVADVGSLSSVDWGRLVTKMSALIDEKTTPGTVEWVEPNFSTTSATDRIVGKVMLMSVMQKFFKYKFCLLCGIPSVTLEGSVEDWEMVRQRVERLPDLGLEDWYKKLTPVLDEFVAAAKGKADKKFWSKICHSEGGGSGPSYLCGWINVFCPFIEERGYVLPNARGDYGRIDTSDIPAGTMTVPFDLDDNGHQMKLEFCCGFFGATMPDEGTVRPSLDWSIRDPSVESKLLS